MAVLQYVLTARTEMHSAVKTDLCCRGADTSLVDTVGSVQSPCHTQIRPCTDHTSPGSVDRMYRHCILYTNTHTQTHTYTQTHTHTYTHTHTHARAHAYIHVAKHTLTHMHTYSHMHAYTHTHTQAHTHTHSRMRERARTHAHTHTHNGKYDLAMYKHKIKQLRSFQSHCKTQYRTI